VKRRTTIGAIESTSGGEELPFTTRGGGREEPRGVRALRVIFEHNTPQDSRVDARSEASRETEDGEYERFHFALRASRFALVVSFFSSHLPVLKTFLPIHLSASSMIQTGVEKAITSAHSLASSGTMEKMVARAGT